MLTNALSLVIPMTIGQSNKCQVDVFYEPNK